jgi:hypothetical protein
LDGVSPNAAPTALEFLKRAGTSTVTRLMTTPSVGPVVALTYRYDLERTTMALYRIGG